MNIQRLAMFAVLSLLVLAMGTTALRVRAAGPLAAPPSVVTLPDEILTGPGIIHRDMSTQPLLANAQMEVIQGTRNNDGTCRSQVTFSALKEDQRPQMAREVAVDPATCRFQIERGNPTSPMQLPAPNATSEKTGGK